MSTKKSRSLKVSPEGLKRILAETSSLYSDEIVSLRLTVTTSMEALAALYLSLYYKYWQTDILIKTIGYRCYSNNYQGKWQLVQEILELEDLSPEKFERIYCIYNPYEFFGNILPLAVKIEKRIKYKKLGPQYSNRKSKVKGINFCEYKDKGVRRLPHEFHGEKPTGPERLNRQKSIACNPILKEEEKSQFQDMPKDTSEKGGDEK